METPFTYQFYSTTASAWEAMFEAVLSAKKSIYWEVYIFVDDAVGSKFIEALTAKAKAGLEIKLIIDAYGSAKFSEKAEQACRNAGIDVLKYSRLYPEWKIGKWLSRMLRRNHRKVLIIDEETVFLGGVNIKAEFKSWDDMYIKISGAMTRPLLRGFAKSYISSGGKKAAVWNILHPKLEQTLPAWRRTINYIVHSPSSATMPRTKRFYLKALAMARESVNLLTPYYVPDRHFLRALALAKKRGVKVNIFLPFRPDLRLLALMARTYFELTVRAGATIYLLPQMNHGKALTVDNRLGLVGSINLIPRSFTHHEESAVTFTDEKMVNDLNQIFNNLKQSAEPLNLERWRKRGWWDRVSEWLAKKLEYFV